MYIIFFLYSSLESMINNNPYNLPERPMQKQGRIYTDQYTNQPTAHYRAQSVQNLPMYSQQNRQANMMMKRSSANMSISMSTNSGQDINNNMRQQYYQARNEAQYYIPSPKNQPPSPINPPPPQPAYQNNNNNININGTHPHIQPQTPVGMQVQANSHMTSSKVTNVVFSNNQNQGQNLVQSQGHANIVTVHANNDKKELKDINIRDSVNSVQSRQIYVGSSHNIQSPISKQNYRQLTDKIQSLTKSIKSNQKRISQLQKSSVSSTLLASNSKMADHDSNEINKKQTHQLVNNPKINTGNNYNQMYQSIVSKFESQWKQNIRKIMEEVVSVREQVKNCIKSNDADKIIHQKVREIKDFNNLNTNNVVINKQTTDLLQIGKQREQRKQQINQIKGQIQKTRTILQQKMKKNNDNLTTLVFKIEQGLKDQLNNINSPVYKSSAIKCTGTAILLRFVESFKVRKNINQNITVKGGSNQVKITLSDNTYYIDGEGFLLDKEQNYLVDGSGLQVKLEEKHIKLLRDNNVLT